MLPIVPGKFEEDRLYLILGLNVPRQSGSPECLGDSSVIVLVTWRLNQT